MKYFPNQRVRIKSNVKAEPAELARFCGEIAHVVGPYTHPSQPEQWYQLDIRSQNGPIIAAESALEPVFDEPVKISWTHSAVVWRPRELEPAVIKTNRVRA